MLPRQLAPIIYGVEGFELTENEIDFFKDAKPAGFIIFKRNILNPVQLTALIASIREMAEWDIPILIDQEGGRVQRLCEPHWPAFPPARTIGNTFVKNKNAGMDLLHDVVDGLSTMQLSLGIDVNCIPDLDVVPPSIETPAIGDRAFHPNHEIVAELGLMAIKRAIENGMTPIMKHMPGHGRASLDSHHDLPHIAARADEMEETDWFPFRHICAEMASHDAFWGMTAHIIYDDIDPELPGTISPVIIDETIRKNINFQGLIVTDDLYMNALERWGDVPERVKCALEAGCDIALHCHGDIKAMEAALKPCPIMPQATHDRMNAWMKVKRPAALDLKPVDTYAAKVAQTIRNC